MKAAIQIKKLQDVAKAKEVASSYTKSGTKIRTVTDQISYYTSTAVYDGQDVQILKFPGKFSPLKVWQIVEDELLAGRLMVWVNMNEKDLKFTGLVKRLK